MEDTTEEKEALFYTSVFSVLLAIVCYVLYLLYAASVTNNEWAKYGVKQVKMPLVLLKEGFDKLIEEHGDTVGLKRDRLWLVTRDLSIIKNVMVKNFNHFTDRPLGITTRSLIGKSVFFLKGQHWRRIRHIITPSFSSGKLKNIFKTVEDRANKLADILEKCARANQLVHIKQVTSQYTSEIIAKTAFGYSSSCLGQEDDAFTHHCKQLLKVQRSKVTKFLPLLQLLPWVHTCLVKVLNIGFFDSIDREADHYLNSVLRRSLKDRQEAEQQGQPMPTDLLQSFIKAKQIGDSIQGKGDDGINEVSSDAPFDVKTSVKMMTEEEVIAQSLLIILAGFETTATTLQMCYYMLARHNDVQEKLYEEITSTVQSDCPTYEELSQLIYMEQVINETLRLYPPLSIVSRLATETRTYGTITIPKDAAVFIPIFSILRDPKHFPDPERFDPERFNKENTASRDPLAFIPFGAGPRLCIGMRLAYLELKTALAVSLRRIKFELNDKTVPKNEEEIPLKTLTLLVTKEPIKLCVKLRAV